MKRIARKLPCLLIPAFFLAACTEDGYKMKMEAKKYVPESKPLYDLIVQLDSTFFTAYNNCDLATQDSLYSDSLEFFHDQGGLMNKAAALDGTKKYICGKVSRELVPGSVEVYPIHDYGAIEMGLHKFHNNTTKEVEPAKESKFIIIWQHRDNEWKIRKVVSLH